MFLFLIFGMRPGNDGSVESSPHFAKMRPGNVGSEESSPHFAKMRPGNAGSVETSPHFAIMHQEMTRVKNLVRILR
ncbi:hypothetical protein [Litchfieldia alkalitelluris]|nr:hypothetical protein [Litchfieldia alkalitelluris]